jgi:hypothetical protein
MRDEEGDQKENGKEKIGFWTRRAMSARRFISPFVSVDTN